MQTHVNLQQNVNHYFESSSEYWNDIYCRQELMPRIYQDRQQTALAWIRKLGLRKDARILEVGCGAGWISVALAKDGYTVDAIDSTMTMLHMTGRSARCEGVDERIRLHLADVHELPLESRAFDLVIAVGVIPWLHSERTALEELQRVLKRRGYLLVTADNEARLIRTLDPASCPMFAPIRKIAKQVMQRFGWWSPPSEFQAKRHDRNDVHRLMNRSGFQELQSCTVGFGPFTFFGKSVLADSTGIGLHHRLQMFASPAWSPLRWKGAHYLVLATKI